MTLGKHTRLVLFVAAVATTGILLAYSLLRPTVVTVASVVENVPVRIFGLGTVEGRVVSKIGFEVGAAIVDLKADHGDLLKKGQVLAQLNSALQEAKVAKAKAAVLTAEVTLTKANANTVKAQAILAQRLEANRRKQELASRQVTSTQVAEEAQRDEDVAKADVLVAENDIEVARAQLTDARAQLAFEEALLSQHTLRAPYDALVVDRQKELGTVIKSGDTIFTIVSIGSVWVLAYIDEARSGAIQEDQPAEVRLRSLPDRIFPARVARIGIESDRVTEERRVYVKCDQCPPRFHLGEQAEVLITVAKLPRALLIPEAAVTGFDGSKGTVWTVDGGRLQRRAVAFGHRTEDARLEMRDALPKDVDIVTRVSSTLREGERARAVRERTP